MESKRLSAVVMVLLGSVLSPHKPFVEPSSAQ